MRTRLRVTPPSLPLALALRSFSNRVGKTKREKKTRGRHCSFRSETRINLSGESAAAGPQIMEIPRNGNVLRSRTGVRRNDGPLQSSYSLGLAPALVVGIVCSRRCLRWWLSSRELALRSLARSLVSPSPAVSPVRFRRRFFHRLLSGAHFSRIRVRGQCPT